MAPFLCFFHKQAINSFLLLCKTETERKEKERSLKMSPSNHIITRYSYIFQLVSAVCGLHFLVQRFSEVTDQLRMANLSVTLNFLNGKFQFGNLQNVRYS